MSFAVVFLSLFFQRLKGVSIMANTPTDLRYRIVTGVVPAFVKFEGAIFLNGPPWRLEMTTVKWHE